MSELTPCSSQQRVLGSGGFFAASSCRRATGPEKRTQTTQMLLGAYIKRARAAVWGAALLGKQRQRPLWTGAFLRASVSLQAVSGFAWPRERAIGMESAPALAVPDVRTVSLGGPEHHACICWNYRRRLPSCGPSGILAYIH